jgi:hypothetical protein
LVLAFRTVLSREPTEAETAELRSILDSAAQRYQANAATARRLAGSRELPPGVTPAEWAAWFNVAHVLLNLDETITKN